MIRNKLFWLSSVSLLASATPVWAQAAQNAAEDDGTTIIVTAQRSNERLQDVPIAVSAFSAESLERQQIKNTSDLQLSLPNITFTKTNFTSSSFTIRGVGDLCTGVSCDQATAIHINDAPLFATRIFEGEFYDMAQIEVLRGPQGTLFGRNATSGVVNLKTAAPDLSGFGAAGEADYGNYNQIKVKGMINMPLGDSAGVRIAGFYLNRDGYTLNQFNNTRIDDRDMYSVRGSFRFEPSDSTRIDIMAQYFHEKDHRMRIQKQLCQRDPTGVLGCLNATRPYETTNSNTTFTGVLTSREFFATQGLPTAFALGSVYGPDVYSGVTNPADPRVVNTDFTPTYFSDEWIVQARLEQELGNGLDLKLEGNWQKVNIDSSQDYNNSVQNRALFAPALNTLAFAAGGGLGAGLQAYLKPIADALIPNGPNGNLCTSLPEFTGTGSYGGHKVCGATPLDFDRSNQENTSWTGEAILSSKWDGPFNFLLGGIYGQYTLKENSYFVNAFSIDYITGILGSFTALGRGLAPSYLGTPFYRNNTTGLTLKSYGIFGEAYYKFSDQLKLTLGLRYNNDQKSLSARTTLASFLVPYGSTDAFSSPYVGAYDADPGVAGNQLLQVRNVKFSEFTGRAVLDWNITPDNLLYFSYSRGYKSGGINPPLSAIFTVPETFKPEFINSFELGSKNTFGALQLNVTAFYYKYKDLQLSRIVARTSVNDNVSANIWGLEAEAIIHPVRNFTVNIGASYLHTEVSEDKMLANPRDFGAGRSDAVIIKDITNGANCAVAPTTAGNAAGANGYVNQVNTLINAGAIPGLKAGAGLQPTAAFPGGSGINSTGAFSVCGALSALTSSVGAAFGGIQVYSSGIPVNIRGNKLPGAPDFKFSMGAQYEASLGNMTLTPRLDVTMTGETTGNIFNGPVNSIDSYWQANAQIQLDGPDKKWYVRGYIQNILDSNSITGLYVTDQSSGNYTNIFTLEPRRYGIAAGFKF
jgi:iron complex outermembrane recepter protein